MRSRPRILIVDDDAQWCDLHGGHMIDLGYEVSFAGTIKEALRLAQTIDFSVVLLDVVLPDGTGIDALTPLRHSRGHPEVIVITGQADADSAEVSFRADAFHYLSKGGGAGELCRIIVAALQHHEQSLACMRSFRDIHAPRLLGKSPIFVARCLNPIAECARSEANVLVHGETGTGKELVAEAIHQNSRRSGAPLTYIDCTSLETLAESRLFGHVKGAFTDAKDTQVGLLAQADGGTLFLDEVGELPMSIQAKLLRVLEERRVRPLGSDRERSIDFRVIAATHRDLTDQSIFRRDLYYRLKSCEVHLPPLRERAEDIPLIAQHHLDRICKKGLIPLKTLSEELIATLMAHDWPGNVRELVHAMDQAVAIGYSHPVLFSRHLSEGLRTSIARRQLAGRAAQESSEPLPDFKTFREREIALAEQRYLQALVKTSQGDMQQALKLSGLAKTRLYGLLKTHRMSLKLPS